MLLDNIIQDLKCNIIQGDTNIEIDGIAYDSRKVKKDWMFVCIEGMTVDGHKFIPNALENGAKVLMVQKKVDVPKDITVIEVSDTRYAMAHVSDNFYSHPSTKLRIIGVTGTKGKTTITYMIKSILENAGQKVGLIGTIANMIGNEVLYSQRTTPESYDLQTLFSEMVEKDIDSAVMEVSSQGLALHRVSCTDFDIGIFTNITRDHIGPKEHKDFDDYLSAKMKLFNMCKRGLVNIDSPYGKEVIKNARCEVLSFGIDRESDMDADIKASRIVKHSDSVEFFISTPWFDGEIKVSVPGEFSVYNALAAAGACGIMGIPYENIKSGLKKISVTGRAEVVETGRDFTVIIDYAHTPDSLENILTTVKEYAPGRVVNLFGCGGDRDRAKRPLMGKISGEIADFTIITSDNPRTEDPAAIIKDIEEGMLKTEGQYITIIDRREAIKYSICNAKPKDIIVLAGKGHETYQTFGDKTIHFDEREIVKEILEEI